MSTPSNTEPEPSRPNLKWLVALVVVVVVVQVSTHWSEVSAFLHLPHI